MLHARQHGLERGASVPRPRSRCRPQARRLNAVGFSFAVVGRGELSMLLLPFKAMLLLERARGRKSGGPPMLAPSFKVQRDNAHNQSSGFAVAPGLKAHNARGPLKVHPVEEQSIGSRFVNRAALLRGPARHPSHPCLTQRRGRAPGKEAGASVPRISVYPPPKAGGRPARHNYRRSPNIARKPACR